LEALHKVIELCDFERILLEVHLNSFLEHILTDIVGHLANEAGSFAVTDFVEDIGGVVCVIYLNLDWMGGGQDVFVDCFM
jgi:hypothetical protein